MSSNRFEAVLFDADGTLLDSLQDLADAMNCVLSHFGFPPHELEKYRFFVGDGMENLVRRTLPEAARNDTLVVSDCLEMMRREYDRNWNARTRPYPGIAELLDELTARRITMAVLSNKPDDFTQKVIKELLPAWHFEIVRGETSAFPRKPDPSSARDIADRLGIKPADFLYIGDTATDMMTATGAGMFPIGVLWGFRTAEELLASGARKLIKEPMELLELL